MKVRIFRERGLSLRDVATPLALIALSLAAAGGAQAQRAAPSTNPCIQPAPGSVVEEPEDLRSENGVLRVDLEYRSGTDAQGGRRYCYVYKGSTISPTLRLRPGDMLILHLKNELPATPPAAGATATGAGQPGNNLPGKMGMRMDLQAGAGETKWCTSARMTSASTNLHFHGLSVPPVCHQDDVLKTLVQPGEAPFEYRFQIPANEPPGLYWYHPHVHGFSKAQVLGGASGALIVEGIERANGAAAGLPERVFVIRDQDLIYPNAQPASGGAVVAPPVVLDRDGDARNTGTGTGKPAKDLSINFVPVAFPDYPPAVIEMKPGEKQLWRVVNSCAITYLNLQVLFDRVPQSLGLVSLDGVPINRGGLGGDRAIWQNHLGVPPGGRVEFIVTGPPNGAAATFMTRSVNTGSAGENDPNRPLATIRARDDAPEPRSILAASPAPLAHATNEWLGSVKPTRTRKLYFSEKQQDPSDPNSPTTFYLTVEGQEPKVFDPNSLLPNIVTHEGDVEDWIIENRSQELHDFHIHQVHFMLLEWFGLAVDEPFLRDTVSVPFWDGKSRTYPWIRVRIDFRDPNSVGTFVYHCHLLEHEDGGMMGVIRVEPKTRSANATEHAPGAKNTRQEGHRLCGPTQLVSARFNTSRASRAFPPRSLAAK